MSGWDHLQFFSHFEIDIDHEEGAVAEWLELLTGATSPRFDAYILCMILEWEWVPDCLQSWGR